MVSTNKILVTLALLILLTGCAKQVDDTTTDIFPSTKVGLFLQAPATVPMDQEFAVEIRANALPLVAGAQVSVAYDPEIFRYERSAEGTFFNKDVATLYFDIKETSRPGLIKDIVVVRQSGDTSGDGLIATMYFTPLRTGQSRMDFGEVLITNSQTTKQDGTLTGLSITVQ